MRTAHDSNVNPTTQTIVSAALLAILVASYFWAGATFIRLLADLPLVFRAGGPLRF